jgi:hypothetical protein
MCSEESSIMTGSIIDFAEIVMGPIDGKIGGILKN